MYKLLKLIRLVWYIVGKVGDDARVACLGSVRVETVNPLIGRP